MIQKLSNIKETSVTNHYTCEFCSKVFVRETSFYKHICERKRRFTNQNHPSNRIGFKTWLDFYAKNAHHKQQRSYIDFIKSPYYLVFVKFGNYCVTSNVINVERYVDWLFKNQIKIDYWATDSNYTKFLIEYLRYEDAYDAIHRSIMNMVILANNENIFGHDYLRYCNTNKICQCITNGKISPWILYQCESGVKFLEKLTYDQQKMIIDYINPELWALKFTRDADLVNEIKTILKAGGY